MNKLKKLTMGMVLANLLTIVVMDTVHAAEWAARSVEQIKQDLVVSDKGIQEYTVKWGDTLYALSKATDIPIEKLAEINNIQNINLIEVGTKFVFDKNNTYLEIQAGEEVVRYQVEDEKTSVLLQPQVEQSQPAQSTETVETTTQNSQPVEEKVAPVTPEVVVEQPVVQETTVAQTPVVEQPVQPIAQPMVESGSPLLYTLDTFLFSGVINWGGYHFTYYSQSVLPGGGLSIPGRHINAMGYVADGDGYIVLANNAPIGTVINTPFGAPGKVYDRGTYGNHFDVYVR